MFQPVLNLTASAFPQLRWTKQQDLFLLKARGLPSLI